MNRIPLTARLRDVPDPIQKCMFRFSDPSTAGKSEDFTKILFRNAPERVRNTEKVRLFRFYEMLFHGLSRFSLDL
jgi:hypothetical protein